MTILENIILLLPLTLLLVLHTRRNTDSNKLMIIFSINKKQTKKNINNYYYVLLYIRRPMKTTLTKKTQPIASNIIENGNSMCAKITSAIKGTNLTDISNYSV